jgi:uncharacterized protein YdeI (YjbR/CyaY-like superfamily)
MEPIFFRTPEEMYAWLEANHETETELMVGFFKKSAPEKGITWSEAVDMAICFGWIDSVRPSGTDTTYHIRFTPRRPNSVWSKVNVAKVERLTAAGLMRPAGIRAFEARREDKTGIYSFEREREHFSGEYEERFKANAAAWEWYNAQAPSYQKATTHWVLDGKKEETRLKRLDELIAGSARGERLKQFHRPAKK